MPKLKQITCSLELGSRGTKLKEYGARYSDGAVETFVAVPDTRTPFHLHVETKGYIAPGLAAFVFIDGQYQCNRNRLRLQLPEDGVDPSQYEIDFHLRQKEEKAADGRFVGREWTFAELKTTNADRAPTLNPNYIQNVGTIEVIILRCKSEGREIPTPDPSDRRRDRSHSKAQSKASSRPARAPSVAASNKAKSASGMGDMGGMFGLFDGANDVLEEGAYLEPIGGLDGANDRTDNPAPIHDGMNGGNRPAGSQFGARGGGRDDRSDVARPNSKVYGDQLDGVNNVFPAVHVNGYSGWEGHGVNDMGGDRFLGYTGDAREVYKRLQRLQGEPVSEPPRGRHEDKNQQQYAAQGNQAGYDNRQAANMPQQPMNARLWLGPQDRAYVDPAGYLVVGDAWIPLDAVDQKMGDLMRKHQTLQRKIFDTNDILEMMPPHHDDFAATVEDRRRFIAKAQGIERTFNGMNDVWNRWHLDQAAKAGRVKYVQAGQPNGGGGDLLAARQAQQDARFGGPAPAQQGAPVNGFQQVGEGAIGGGAPYNQAWQTPNREQKPANKPASNAGWDSSAKKKDDAGGWGGEQKNDAWGTSGEKKDDGGGGGWGGNQQDNADQAANSWGDNKAASHRSQSRRSSHHSNYSHHSGSKKSGGWGDAGNQQGGDGAWGSSGSQKGDNAGGGGWNDAPTSQKSDKGWGGDGGSGTPHKSASRAGNYDPATPTPQYKPREYWNQWKLAATPHESSDPNTKKKRDEPRQPYQYPAPELPPVASSKKEDAASHGVQPGKGADYSHRCHRPNYMDEMTAPYAVFSFKYRSRAALQKILKFDTGADTEAVVVNAEKEKLLMMPRERLVEDLMKLRTPGKGQQPRSSGGEKKPASQNGGWGGDNGGGNGDGWRDNKTPSRKSSSNKGGSAAGGWGDDEKKSNSGGNGGWGADEKKSNSGGNGGWGDAEKKSNSGGNGGWGGEGQKSASKKSSQKGDWDKENQGGGGGWDAPAEKTQQANNGWGGGGGWDGNNDSKPAARTPANITGYKPKIKDFAHDPEMALEAKLALWEQSRGDTGPAQPYDFGIQQPAAPPAPMNDQPYNFGIQQPAALPAPVQDQPVEKPWTAHVSMATGFTRSEPEHRFKGNPEFVKSGGFRGGRGAGTGRGGYQGVAASPVRHGHHDAGAVEEPTPSLIRYNTKKIGGGHRGGGYRGGGAAGGGQGPGMLDLGQVDFKLNAVPGVLQLDGEGAGQANGGWPMPDAAQADGGWGMPDATKAQGLDSSVEDERMKVWQNGGPPAGPTGW